MAGLLCQQSLVYIVLYVVFSIIFAFILGFDLQMNIIKHSWVQMLITFILTIAIFQLLCYYKFNKTAWGILIFSTIISSISLIVSIMDPEVKEKVKQDMKKKEEENQN